VCELIKLRRNVRELCLVGDATSFRDALLTAFDRRCAHIWASSTLAVKAGLLNPATAKLEGVDDRVKEQAWNELHDEIKANQPVPSGDLLILPTDEQFSADLNSYRHHVCQVMHIHDPDTFDPLAWWRSQGSQAFPKLVDLARALLCIPASSSASERAFSGSERVFSEHRRSITPENLQMYCFIRNNLSAEDLERQIALHSDK